MHLLRRRMAKSFLNQRRDQSSWLAMLITINVLLASVVVMLAISRTAIALPKTTEEPSTSAPTSTQTVPVAENKSKPVATKAVAQKTPSCRQSTYRLPSSLNPSSYADGVHIKIDSPQYYNVYGTSVDEIWRQIARCTPVHHGSERFAANTGYNLSSYYGYTTNGDGTCSMTQVSVGLHVNQVYPKWVNTGSSSKVAAAWNSFITHLRTHENGHISLDKRYAYELYNGLKAIQDVDCHDIRGVINGKVQKVTKKLTSANDGYDHKTNHGATQGAVM